MKSFFALLISVVLLSLNTAFAQWSSDPTVNTAICTATG